MKIGIGLPASVLGVESEVILDWARRADSGPFSSLGIIDRLVYPNYEPMITLAAAAGVTQRVRLMTTVLLAPLRNAGVLAKQAATLDAISRGRFTLGLGVGRREDDFLAAPARFNNRGRRFESQLDTMKRVWSGEGPIDGVDPMGPATVQRGGPELLIGGRVPQAIRRVGRWADGYLGAGGDPSAAQALYQVALEAWEAEGRPGRPGRPRFVSTATYALGPNAGDHVASYLRHYYSFLGPAVEQMVQGAIASTEAVRGMIQDYSDIGVDEIVFLPTAAGMDQLDRLADLVG